MLNTDEIQDSDIAIIEDKQLHICKLTDREEINKLTESAKAVEKQCFLQIGKLYSVLHADDCEDAFSQDMAELLSAQKTVAECREQIRRLEASEICPKCAFELSESDVFCPSCGAHVRNAETKFHANGVHCSICGSAIRGNAKFCSVCGSPTSTAPAVAYNPKENANDSEHDSDVTQFPDPADIQQAAEIAAIVSAQGIVDASQVPEVPKIPEQNAEISEPVEAEIASEIADIPEIAQLSEIDEITQLEVGAAEDTVAQKPKEESLTPEVVHQAAMAGKKICGVCSAEMPGDMFFCTSCGNPLPEIAVFAEIEPIAEVENIDVIGAIPQGIKFESPAGLELSADVLNAVSTSQSVVFDGGKAKSAAPEKGAMNSFSISASICKYCGATIEAGMSFCKTCGKPSEDSTWRTATKKSAQLCMACGTVVEPGLQFCPTCGKRVAYQSYSLSTAGVKNCPKCGKEIPGGALFCIGCGASTV